MNQVVLKRGSYLGSTLKSRSTAGVLLTLSRYEPNRRFGRHVHEHPGVFVLVAGQHRETRRCSAFEQSVATAIFHVASDAHATELGPEGMTGLNISFDRSWLQTIGFESEKVMPSECCPGAADTFLSLKLLAIGLRDSTPDEDIETLALEILASPDVETERRCPQWLRMAKEAIHERFEERLSLHLLAEEAAVHPSYFARAFRSCFRCSVYEYLHRVRLSEAVRLMQLGTSIAEAAAKTGYADQAHLSRTFRKRLSRTPGSMRRITES